MRLKLFWLAVSFALLICVLALPTGNYEENTSVFSLLIPDIGKPQPYYEPRPAYDGRWVFAGAVALFFLGIGGLYFGMRCLLGKTEMKTGWAIGIGLPCTAFGLGVFLFAGLFVLFVAILFISGGPSM